MRSGYAALTIVKQLRKREGLVQAHVEPPERHYMVLGNITIKLQGIVKSNCSHSRDAEVCRDVLS